MSIVKAFIGGVVGAAIATVALSYLRDGSMRGYEWFPVVTGLLTGLGTRILTGSSGRSVVTGGVAALLSLLAILGGGEVLAYATMPKLDMGPAPEMEERVASLVNAKQERADDSESGSANASDPTSDLDSSNTDPSEPAVTDDADTDVMASEEEQSEKTAREAELVSESTSANNKARAQQMKMWRAYAPYLFSGLGVLLAYQLGRGSGGGNRQSSDSSVDEPADESHKEEAT